MVTDSITNASIPMAASNVRDLAKKKRVNRSAKLKQVKRDARREQWLSQVKNKNIKEDSNCHGAYNAPLVHERSESDGLIKNLEINPGIEENDESNHHFSEPESNSPTSPASSVLGGTESGTNFSSGSSRSSSGGSYSGSVSGEEEADDDCLDDWEAIADALAATDDKLNQHNPSLGLPELPANIGQLDSTTELPPSLASGTGIQKPQPNISGMEQHKAPPTRAWRPDDAYRPQNLPNLSKQHSLPLNSDRKSGRGCAVWGCNSVLSAPTSCPICFEDLDLTDSSFLPCSCGFRVCLFCHKRILEEDARCPGCRKQYDHVLRKGQAAVDGRSVTFQLARSYSMYTRS